MPPPPPSLPGPFFTWAELEHAALGVVIQAGLRGAVAGAAANSGGPVLVTPADHGHAEHGHSLRARRLPHLVRRLLELDGGGCRDSGEGKDLDVT